MMRLKVDTMFDPKAKQNAIKDVFETFEATQTMIFTNTKKSAEDITKFLTTKGIKAQNITSNIV